MNRMRTNLNMVFTDLSLESEKRVFSCYPNRNYLDFVHVMLIFLISISLKWIEFPMKNCPCHFAELSIRVFQLNHLVNYDYVLRIWSDPLYGAYSLVHPIWYRDAFHPWKYSIGRQLQPTFVVVEPY